MLLNYFTCMGETERPKTEIRCSVRDASEAELDRVDGLVDKRIAKVKLQEEENKPQTRLPKIATSLP